jgi:crossover junction endodeoxyribonuclease RusA
MPNATLARMRRAAALERPEPERIDITLPSPPRANRNWRTNRAGVTYLSPESKAYKSEVATLFLAAGIPGPFHGDVTVCVTWYRKIRRGDLDGVFKALFDALNGLAWIDDGQIAGIHAFRYDDPKNPRVEILVTPLDKG